MLSDRFTKDLHRNLLHMSYKMDIKHICELIDERKEELFGLLISLIKINSENFGTHGNEKELAEHINKL